MNLITNQPQLQLCNNINKTLPPQLSYKPVNNHPKELFNHSIERHQPTCIDHLRYFNLISERQTTQPLSIYHSTSTSNNNTVLKLRNLATSAVHNTDHDCLLPTF